MSFELIVAVLNTTRHKRCAKVLKTWIRRRKTKKKITKNQVVRRKWNCLFFLNALKYIRFASIQIWVWDHKHSTALKLIAVYMFDSVVCNVVVFFSFSSWFRAAAALYNFSFHSQIEMYMFCALFGFLDCTIFFSFFLSFFSAFSSCFAYFRTTALPTIIKSFLFWWSIFISDFTA